MKNLFAVIPFTILSLYSSQSFASACDYGAVLFDQGQYQRAYNILSPLAKSGDACGQYYMGMMYYNGVFVLQDVRKAEKLLNSSAKKGYEKAKTQLDNLE